MFSERKKKKGYLDSFSYYKTKKKNTQNIQKWVKADKHAEMIDLAIDSFWKDISQKRKKK